MLELMREVASKWQTVLCNWNRSNLLVDLENEEQSML
jgi:hypothetical protein